MSKLWSVSDTSVKEKDIVQTKRPSTQEEWLQKLYPMCLTFFPFFNPLERLQILCFFHLQLPSLDQLSLCAYKCHCVCFSDNDCSPPLICTLLPLCLSFHTRNVFFQHHYHLSSVYLTQCALHCFHCSPSYVVTGLSRT